MARDQQWRDRIRRDELQHADGNPSVFVKPIASGEIVIASRRSKTATFLGKAYSDAVAVEMEGHGFLTALYAHSNREGLSIRGISDLLGRKSTSDASGYQEIASANASAFALEVLAKFDLSGLHPNQVADPASLENPADSLSDSFWLEFVAVFRSFTPLGRPRDVCGNARAAMSVD